MNELILKRFLSCICSLIKTLIPEVATLSNKNKIKITVEKEEVTMNKLHMKLTMVESHKLTKEIKNEFKEVNYKFQLGLCMKYFMEERKEMKVVLTKEEIKAKYQQKANKYFQQAKELKAIKESVIKNHGESVYNNQLESIQKSLSQYQDRLGQITHFTIAQITNYDYKVEKSIKRKNKKIKAKDIAKARKELLSSLGSEKEFLCWCHNKRIYKGKRLSTVVFSEVLEGTNLVATKKRIAKEVTNQILDKVNDPESLSEGLVQSTTNSVFKNVQVIKGSELKELIVKHDSCTNIETKVSAKKSNDKRGYNTEFCMRLTKGGKNTLSKEYGKVFKTELPVFNEMTLVYYKDESNDYVLTWVETGIQVTYAKRVKQLTENLEKIANNKDRLQAYAERAKELLEQYEITQTEIDSIQQVA